MKRLADTKHFFRKELEKKRLVIAMHLYAKIIQKKRQISTSV